MITPGEPAGIGEQLSSLLTRGVAGRTGLFIADATPHQPGSDARFAAHPPALSPNSPAHTAKTVGTLTLLPVALHAPVTAGQLAVGKWALCGSETLARAL